MLNWQEQTVPLEALKPFERNPRRISKEAFAKLKSSLEKLGQFAPIPVTRDMRLIGGHQRLQAFQELGWKEIRVSVPDCELSDVQFKEIMIRSNTNSGTFDMDILSSDFDMDELISWDVPQGFMIGEPKEARAKKEQSQCEQCGKKLAE
jgi:hypothetical protein